MEFDVSDPFYPVVKAQAGEAYYLVYLVASLHIGVKGPFDRQFEIELKFPVGAP